MDDIARRALSRILFFDTTTPVDEFVRHAADNPVDLDDEETAALAGANGPFSLWPEREGCALLAADLHALVRDASLPDNGLVLRLPRSFGSATLTRIASGAFRPWLSYGVGLRLLLLPEGMVGIDDGGLAPLCFEHLSIPSTLTCFGKREVRWNKLTRYPDSIRFSVHPDNPAFAAHDGSLYSKDGTELVAQAYPYDAHIEVRPGVKRLREDAFIHAPLPPCSIACPDSLEEARDAIDPSLLWIRANATPFARILQREGRRGVSPAYRIVNGCVFDFDEEQAMLISAKADEHAVALPESVEGRPLTRVGYRALPRCARSVALAEHVTAIEDGNACEGAKRIVLNEGLESIGEGCFMRANTENAVLIPRSVKRIGARSFCASRVRFEALGTTVFIPTGSHRLFEPNRYRTLGDGQLALAKPDDENASAVPFDMQAYDELLASDRSFFGKTEALVDRLAGDVAIEPARIDAFVAQLEKNADVALSLIAQRRSKRAVTRLAEQRFYENEQCFLDQCEKLRRYRAAEALGWLMEHRARNATGPAAKPSERFAF